MPIAERIRQSLQADSTHPAVTIGGHKIQGQQLLREAELFGRFLEELQLPAEAVVALRAEPRPEFVIGLVGSLLAGRVALPFGPTSPLPVVLSLLEEAACRLVVAPRHMHRALEARGREILEFELMSASLFAAESSRRQPPCPSSQTRAMLLPTSGTTGRPKLVVHNHGSLRAGIESVERAWSLSSKDHLLSALPLFHVHGLVLGLMGALAVGMPAQIMERFDETRVLDHFSQPEGPTVFFGVPTMYHRLVERPAHESWSMGRMRLCVSGSAPLSPEIFDAFKKRSGLEILERYGLTESLMVLSNPLQGTRRPGRVGRPLPGVEARLADARGLVVAEGCEGEIQVRSPALFSAYLNDAEATQEVFTNDAWLRTGDLGIVDPDTGDWCISGRQKELIISGGFNVHPRAVEDCLLAETSVAEAAVCGQPDPEWGERVVAFLVPRAKQSIDVASLDRRCREHLAPYARPREYRQVTDLPRNDMGKLQRHLISWESDDAHSS